MKRLLLLIITTVLGLTACMANYHSRNAETQVSMSPTYNYEASRAIAILPLANAGRDGVNLMITEKLSINLMNIGFKVIDQSQTEKAAGDIGITLDRTPSREQVSMLGKQLGVSVIVSGSCISDGKDDGDENSVRMLSTRFLDVASGETLIYAITYPDGVMPVTRKLAYRVRNSILDDLFKKANHAFDTGNYQNAITGYTSIIGIDPSLVGAYRNRGAAFARTGDYKKALADMDLAIALSDTQKTETKHPVFSVGPPIKEHSEKAELLLNRGIALNRSGSPAAALVDFDKALAAGADKATVYANRGYARFKMNEIKNSLYEYNRAISAAPKRAEIYYQRGLVLESVKIRDAIADFTHAIRLDKRFAAAYAARAAANMQLGYKDGPISDYTTAIELEPQNTEYINGRAAALSMAGLQEQAILDYSKTLEIAPDNSRAYLGRGMSHAENGDLKRASSDFKNALKADPGISGAVYLEMGILQEKQGKYNESIENFSKAIEASGKDGRGYSYRGMALERMADYRNSALDYSRALELKADNARDYYNLGYVELQSGNYRKAISDLDRSATLDPQNPFAYSNLAFARQQTGNYSQAITDYSRALTLKPENDTTDYRRRYPDSQLDQIASEYQPFFIYYNRGLSYLASRNYRQAIADFDQAVQLAPKSAETFVKRGMAKQQLNDMDAALKDYNRAIELDFVFAEAYFARGTWYEQSGAFSMAISDYGKAITFKPDFAQACFSRGLLYAQMNLNERALTDIKTAAAMNLQQAKDYLLTHGVEW